MSTLDFCVSHTHMKKVVGTKPVRLIRNEQSKKCKGDVLGWAKEQDD